LGVIRYEGSVPPQCCPALSCTLSAALTPPLLQPQFFSLMLLSVVSPGMLYLMYLMRTVHYSNLTLILSPTSNPQKLYSCVPGGLLWQVGSSGPKWNLHCPRVYSSSLERRPRGAMLRYSVISRRALAGWLCNAVGLASLALKAVSLSSAICDIGLCHPICTNCRR
jgi:hypothetical protein